MSVENKVPTPTIRFRGFSEEWEEKAFGNCFANIPSNTLSRADLNYETGLAKNIHYGDVLIKFGEVLDVKKETLPFITNNEIVVKLKSATLRDGDVIIADAAEDETVGKCTELFNIKNQIVFSGLHTIAVRSILPFASKYLGYYLNSSAYHDRLLSLMQGTKVLSISKTTIQTTRIKFPKSPKEQNKIGNYFQQLVTLIAQHQQKHDKLLNLKKSLLEKMFTKQGATVPEIRFKRFSGEWEGKVLGEDVADIYGGGTPPTQISEYWNGDIHWYSPTEIGKNVYVYNSEKKITQEGLEKSSAKILPANKTVLFTSRAGIGDMAILSKDGCTNQGFQSFVLKGGYDTYFLYSIGSQIKEYALKHASGSTFLEISGKQLSKMAIKMPSPAEQTKIGTIFKHLDTLISQHQTQLKKLNNIKQACLEKMFV